jgi:hypothetical protein
LNEKMPPLGTTAEKSDKPAQWTLYTSFSILKLTPLSHYEYYLAFKAAFLLLNRQPETIWRLGFNTV